MSERLRIGLVAEGPTDGVVIESALLAVLGRRPFILTQLQPEASAAFGPIGAGWGGVYRWCKQSVLRGAGRLSGDQLVFSACDVLILHLDADVARARYSDANITPSDGDPDLPCDHPCPPSATSADAVRSVLLGWCGEAAVPPAVVFCVPSKNTEAWVVASLFPHDQAVVSAVLPFECYLDPEARLGQQPLARRLRKRRADYADRAEALRAAWPTIAKEDGLTAALRFQNDFLSAPALTTQ